MLRRAIIELKGSQVVALLNGISTQNVKLLTAKNALAACFLDNKARVLYEAILIQPQQNSIWIDIDKDLSNSFISHLKRYSLGKTYQANLLQQIAVSTQDSQDKLLQIQDPRAPFLPTRYYIKSSPGQLQFTWKYGILEGRACQGRIPYFLNFDFYNYISFNKGCYIGQQIISRTYHTGIVRKRAFLLEGQSVKLGILTDSQNQSIGEVILSSGKKGIGLLRYTDRNISQILSQGVKCQKVQQPEFSEFLKEQEIRIKKNIRTLELFD